jgi:hypothetical protein
MEERKAELVMLSAQTKMANTEGLFSLLFFYHILIDRRKIS